MGKFKSVLKSYLWLIIMIGLFAVAFAAFTLQSGRETEKFNEAVDNRLDQSNKAVQEAVNANAAAITSDIERQTEDARRGELIKPKLDAARRNSQNSKLDVDRAKQKLNETNKTLHNPAASRARNCAELSNLFPDEHFQYCGQ